METLTDKVQFLKKDQQFVRIADEVSSDNGDIILIIANKGVQLLVENLLKSLENIGLKNVLLVALDEQIHSSLESKCITFYSDILDSSVGYLSQNDYEFYLLTKYKFIPLLALLELGYNVLFTDADVALFQNPFPYLSGDADVVIQYGQGEITNYEEYMQTGQPMGDMGDRYQFMCTGFFYTRRTHSAIIFFQEVFKVLESKYLEHSHDQDILNEVYKKNPSIISVEVFDPLVFPNGGIFKSTSLFNNQVKSTMVMLHANYYTGLKSKVELLYEAGGWYLSPFRSFFILILKLRLRKFLQKVKGLNKLL